MNDPHPPAPAPQPAPTPQTAIGTVALIAAAAALLVTVATSFAVRALIYATAAGPAYQAVSLAGGLFTALLAVTALILGILGLRRGRIGRARSGIAAGIAVALLAAQLSNLVLTAATDLFYRFL